MSDRDDLEALRRQLDAERGPLGGYVSADPQRPTTPLSYGRQPPARVPVRPPTTSGLGGAARAIITLIVVSGAVLVIAVVTSDDATRTERTGGQTTTAASASVSAESQLMSAVDEIHAAPVSCNPVAPRYTGARARVSCRVPPDQHIHYVSFADASGMYVLYNRFRSNTRYYTANQGCSRNATWWFRSSPSVTRGQVMLRYDPLASAPFIIWTYTRHQVLGYMGDKDVSARAICRAWRNLSFRPGIR